MEFPQITLPYDDFMLNQMIDPEEFDINNHTLLDAINLLNTWLTTLTESTTDGDAGADHVAVTQIGTFAETRLQPFLEALHAKLTNTLSGQSGAEFIGSAPITGLTGSTPRAQIVSMKALAEKALADVAAVRAEVNRIVFEAGNNNPEIVGARGAYPLLKDRLGDMDHPTIKKASKDENGIFRWVYHSRASDGTLFCTSYLSGGTSPQYTTRTVHYYHNQSDMRVEVYTLLYDADGTLIEEVLT